MRPERFPECSHLDLHPLRHALAIRHSPALLADDTHRMGLVEQQPRAEAILQLHHLRHRRDIAIHAVNRLRDHQHARLRMLLRGPPQMAFQAVEIIVGKHTDHRPAQPRRIHQTRVGELVEHHHITTSAQRGNRSRRRRIPARKRQRRLRALEIRQLLLEFPVRRQRAAHQPRRTRAEAAALPLRHRRLAQRGVVRQTQIIVRGKIPQRPRLPSHLDSLRALERVQFTQESLRLDLREPLRKKLLERPAHAQPPRTIATISRTARSKPTAIARDTIECPMFNSSKPGNASIGAVFS